MKLCMVTHKVVKGDGQGRVNYEITWEAIRRGHEVTLLASAIAPELACHGNVNWVPIAAQTLPLKLLQNLFFSWQSARWLQRHHHRFHVIKVNGAITKFPGHINAVHFVHSAWARSRVFKLDRSPYGLYQRMYTALNAIWEKQAFRQAELIVAVSQKIKEELIAIGVPQEKIEVIFNGVDPDEFCLGAVERRTLGLPDNVPLAFFAGDIRTPRKNLDTILHALVQVPELHLAIAGKTKNSPYPQLAKELGIQKQTHFLGYRQDIPLLMQASDFFVFPSRYEACTLVLLEAMASGKPVITAVTAGGAEIVTPNVGFVLSNPDDRQELVAALQILARDQLLRSQMGQAAREIAEEYCWTNMAQHYLDLCEKEK